jgi:hypothetical protein
VDEGDARRVGIWFLGSLLVLQVVRYAFSYYGLAFTQIVRLRLGIAQVQLESWLATALYVLLGLGLVVTVALAFLVVSRYRAPKSLWLAAVALSVLQLGLLAATMVQVWLLDSEMNTGAVAYERVVMGVPFFSERVYFAAAIGYPLAAWLGCRLGAARRKDVVRLP